MTGKTHALIGAAAVAVLNPNAHTDLLQFGLLITVGVVGALAPDVDSDESEIRQLTQTNRKRGPHGWLISWLMPSHRGITHSLLALVAVWLLTAWLPLGLGTAFVLGYASHLLADGITTSGIPLLWPLRVRFIPFFRPVRTGGPLEAVVAVAVVGYVCLTFAPEVVARVFDVLGWLVN